MPNFLIIGSAKGGTTSLHYYLNQHPQIFMSAVKEPRFFALEGEVLNFRNPDAAINHNSVTTLEAYQALFKDVTNEIAIGEASPLYLYSAKAVERIKHYIPQAKLIAVLRNPVDRAFSCYTHLRRENYEKLSFAEGLKAEEQRIQDNWAHLWHYKQAGFYYEQLKRYYDAFAPAQIKVYLFEDLNTDSTAVTQDICRFLGVDDSFQPELSRQNVSGIPKSRLVHDFFARKNSIREAIAPFIPSHLRQQISRKIKTWNLGKKPELDPVIRQELVELYREDILKLQDLLQRDLSHWLH
ncbi:MAG TPA: sulfotransferase [Synechococcales cyanobacterium M55_K2018_004]|nr:sulfotransferase [Synechococcales cyanobacterium M55_K2018_004]